LSELFFKLGALLLFVTAWHGLIAAQVSPRSHTGDAATARPKARTQNYDGIWWASVGTKERAGFVSGNEDCRVWDLKRLRKHGWSDSGFADTITRFYAKHRELRTASVATVMDRVDDESKSYEPISPKGGEVWKNLIPISTVFGGKELRPRSN